MMSRTTASLLALLTAFAGPALAQSTVPGVSRPGAVESAPLPPPPGTPAEAPAAQAPAAPAAPAPATPAPAAPAPATPPASPAPATPPAATAPSPAAPATAGRPTLVPGPGDPVNVDEVTLPAKPAAVLVGQSTWDDGFKNLKNAFRKIEEELTRAGISPAGRPLTVFVETEDMGFRYEAMIPIPEAPAGRANLTPEVRFGRTPEGKALRFVHKEPYEEIDSTYETIEAYLEAKGVTVKNVFVEEYVTDLTEPNDPNLEINVFVQPQ
ncbi:MAG TPA: GyrI-like domain-containing protein [Microvirga sp.]